MKISCDCGNLIPDQTDDLPQKAHLIPDQNWNALWEEIDAAILVPLSKQKLTEAAASMRLRTLIGNSLRQAYQCRECGRLYIDSKQDKLHCFVPADASTPRQLLAAHADS